ncbi:hypothetical protein IMZ11_19485 [Microtetraspora sp. AC03309]|nr:hypothetical protein [Microtetraspora sp. AC03309]MCC5577812.1 hypothetical protein [Microtetraspora sp. AC03309]
MSGALYGTWRGDEEWGRKPYDERRFRMGKRARKSKARKKKQANHGKRPTGR